MSSHLGYKSTVRNGVVILPPQADLPEGAQVMVTPLETPAEDPPFLQAILKLAKPRDWPADFALNHAHHAKGHPQAALADTFYFLALLNERD